MLGVSPNASAREITKAYRELAARYHPDKHQDNELQDLAQEKLAELNQAFSTLSDPARRAAYDAKRNSGQSYSSASQAQGQATITSFPYIRLVILLAFCGGAYFMLRYIRNPRVGAIVGAVLAIIWFGPRIYRLIKRKKG